jgi:predicted site-specific integrase-resolvase
MSKSVKAQEAAEYYNISTSNLRKWARDGKIEVDITPGGHYNYIIPVTRKDEPEHPTKDGWTENIIYSRVSSKKQIEDLKRQSKYLKQHYPKYTIVEDIGSGINYKRKGFQDILEQLFSGNVKKVVVAHPDRFSRFSFEFFQWLFERFGAVLESIEAPTENSGEDLVSDIMEIFTVFTARYYGRRKYGHSEDKNIPE